MRSVVRDDVRVLATRAVDSAEPVGGGKEGGWGEGEVELAGAVEVGVVGVAVRERGDGREVGEIALGPVEKTQAGLLGPAEHARGDFTSTAENDEGVRGSSPARGLGSELGQSPARAAQLQIGSRSDSRPGQTSALPACRRRKHLHEHLVEHQPYRCLCLVNNPFSHLLRRLLHLLGTRPRVAAIHTEKVVARQRHDAQHVAHVLRHRHGQGRLLLGGEFGVSSLFEAQSLRQGCEAGVLPNEVEVGEGVDGARAVRVKYEEVGGIQGWGVQSVGVLDFAVRGGAAVGEGFVVVLAVVDFFVVVRHRSQRARRRGGQRSRFRCCRGYIPVGRFRAGPASSLDLAVSVSEHVCGENRRSARMADTSTGSKIC